MAAHQTSIESVRSEAASAEALLALAHGLTTLLFLIITAFSPLILSLPVLEDVFDVACGLVLLIIFILLLLQVLVHLIHKVEVKGPHVLARLEGFLHISELVYAQSVLDELSLAELVVAIPTVAFTAPTMTITVNVTKALSSVHEGFVSVA